MAVKDLLEKHKKVRTVTNFNPEENTTKQQKETSSSVTDKVNRYRKPIQRTENEYKEYRTSGVTSGENNSRLTGAEEPISILQKAARRYAENSTPESKREQFNLLKPSTWDGGDDLYDFINDIDGYREYVKTASAATGQKQEYGDYTEYSRMNDDEVAMYNYLYDTEGKESAEEYLESIHQGLSELQFKATQAAQTAKAKKNPVLYSVASVPINTAGGIASGLDLLWQNARRAATGEEVNYYTPAQQLGASGSTIRSAVGEEIEKNTDFSVAGRNAARFAYDTGLSLADSLYAAGAGAGLGSAILGASAGSAKARDVAERGGTDDQAMLAGIAAGAFEALFEKWSIGNLKAMKEVPVSGVKDVVGNIIKSMGTNASEEAITEFSNIVFDMFAMGDVSEWKQSIDAYKKNGMSEDEALDATFTDMAGRVLEAGVGGALMGLGMGGVGSFSSAANSRAIGREINQSNGYDTLMQAAMQMQEGTDSRKYAEKLSSSGKPANDGQTGRLYQQVMQDKADSYIAQDKMQVKDARSRAVEDMQQIFSQRVAETTTTKKTAENAAEQAEQKKPYNNTKIHPVEANSRGATPVPAVYNATGEAVSIDGVASVENGAMYVRLSDGGTASLDDVSLDDPTTDKLYAAAASFDTPAAQTFISEYDGTESVENYSRGFKSMYESGRAGLTYEQALQGSLYGQEYLSQNAREAAFSAGMNAAKNAPAQAVAELAEEETAEPKTAEPQAENTTQKEKRPVTGGVSREFNAKLSKEQENSIRVIDAVAKSIGRTVHVVDNIEGNETGAELNVTDPKGSIASGNVNAFFDPNTNEYYISLNSIGQAYMYFAVHESIHDIRKNNELGYENIEQIVFDSLEANGLDVESLLAVQKELYPNENEAYWREEVVANTVPTILRDSKTADMFLDRIMEADADTRSAFEKLLDSIREFLRNAFDALKDELSWQQMQVLEQDMDSIDRIREAYFAALEDVIGSSANQYSGTVKYSINPSFAKEYDLWNKKDPTKKFRIGITSEALQSIGVRKQDVLWDASKIIKIKKDHPQMTDAIIKQVPNIIEKPILVMQSKQAKSRIVMFGELFDARGIPVLSVLELEPTDRYGIKLDLIKVASAYGKDANPQKLIDESKILYVDPNKNRTDAWLTSTRLQLPVAVTKYGSINKIAYSNAPVKKSIRQSAQDDAIKFSLQDSERAAIDMLGTTFNWNETGYITPTGKQLDFSGKKDGGPGGYRSMDHREIVDIYGEDTDMSGSEAMVSFMADGNIRIMPESGGINLSVLPTAAQREKLQAFIRRNNGEVIVDFDDLQGNTLHSIEYPRGSGPMRITNDICRYFEEGIVPEVSDVQKFRFSLQDTSHANVAALEKENAKLRQAVDSLKAEFKLTKGHKVTDAGIKKLAAKTLKEYSSSYDAETFRQNLRTMYDYISETDEPVWDEVVEMGVGMAKAIVENSSELNQELYEYYAGLRKYLRETGITLNSRQREETAHSVGSYREYRSALFGSVKLVNDGVSLDVAWKDLSAQYPELFDLDAREGEMPMLLLSAVGVTKPVYENPYGFDMDGAAFDLFLRLQEDYFDLPEVKTFADKQAEKLAKAKADYKEKLQQVRTNSKDKYNERLKKLKQENTAKRQELSKKYNEAKAKQHKADMERYKKQYNALADRKNEQIMKQKAAFRERVERDKERDIASKYRKRIEKTAKELAAWIANPTEKKHVPDSMRGVVSELLNSLDFTGSAKARDWKYRMERLAGFMENLDKAGGEDIYLDISETYVDGLRSLAARTDGNLAKMDNDQLADLDGLLRQLKLAVQKVNTVIVNGRRQHISDFGEAVIAQAEEHGTKYGGNDPVSKLLNSGNIKPIYFFKKLGGPFKDLFDGIREAQNQVAFGAAAAQKEYQRVAKKYNATRWLDKKNDVLKMKTERGDSIELTRQQAMSLYATWKREKANAGKTGAKHLSNGGFVYADEQTNEKEGKLGIKRKRTFRDAKPKPMSERDMLRVAEWLTADQKGFVDELVGYLSTTMAAVGNTTSLEMSGYKKFSEGYYFPYKTAREYLRTEPGKAGLENGNRWKNWGSAKATQAGAKTPVVLQDFTEVWGDHVNEMLMYAHMTIPQENLLRVFNYKPSITEESSTASVKAALQNAYGKSAAEYIDTLLGDLGGNVLNDPRDNFAGKLTSSYKKGAVLASLSVAVQQPSSIIRAMALVDPKYFAITAKKGAYDEAMKYAGTAVVKKIGGFDTGTGHGMADWITEIDPDNKVKAFFEKDGQYRDKVLGWLPGKMDEATWGVLWEAVKNEVADKQHLKRGSEEHLQAAGRRFNDVVDFTQVYDSTLARSELMRSKGALAQMTTSFMSEPVTAYNMLYDAFTNRKNNPVTAKRAVAAFIGTAVFNSMLKSIVYAMRDDDEDQAYLEKYVEAFAESILVGKANVLGVDVYGLGSDLNPLNMIPYARDVMSIAQGYDVERADISLIEDLMSALEKFDSESASTYDKVSGLAKSISAMLGVPLKNIMRDMEAIYKTAKQYVFGGNNVEMTERGIKNAIRAGLGSDTTVKAEAENLYKAYAKDNKAKMDKALNEISALYTDKVDGYIRAGMERKEAEKKARSSVLASCTGVLKPMYQAAGSTAEKLKIRSLALRIKIGSRQLYKDYDFDQNWKE